MKIFEIILIIITLISSILIGSPLNYNCLIVNIAICIVGIAFIIYRGIVKKEKIISSSLDIAVLILCLSPLIPIIFNKYINLIDSVISVIKYLNCFIIYLITKNIVANDKKGINLVTNLVIIGATILSIIGIDNMTTRFFSDSLESLGIPYVINLEKRMFASFGYANSFAIILAVAIILILDKIANRKKKKVELIYAGILFLNLSCLILSLSRGVILFFCIAIIFYIIMQKEKNKKIYNIYSLAFIGLLSLIYSILWQKGELIWTLTILFFILSMVILYLLDKLYKKIEKITKKTYIIFSFIIIILGILFIVIGLKLVIPLKVFMPGEKAGEVKYKIQNIEPNTEYILKFDIDSKSTSQNINNYAIRVEEENKYYKKVTDHEIEFNNYSGLKEIKFTTTEETIELALVIESKYPIAQLGLNINAFTINEKEHPLNYLYLPVRLVDKLTDINLKDKSAWERGTFYYDALKIIKDNFIFGLGGNAWKYKFQEVQSYDYYTVEVHSYPLQVFLENGIVGFISLITIIILVIKNNKKIDKSIFIAFLLLILHSFMDFNMSFFYIMLIAFTLLGIIASQIENNKDYNKLDQMVNIMLIIIFLLGSIIGVIAQFYR